MDNSMMTRKPFLQGLGNGLCSVYAVLNAMAIVFPARMTDAMQEELVGVVSDAFPGDAKSLIRDGAERPEIVSMLNGLARWTQEQDWPHWHYHDLHPIRGEPSEEFWDAVRAELVIPNTAAVVGFGADSRAGTRYEPHWTCVRRVADTFIELRDSTEYKRVPRRDTGVRPEPRWAVEDCFVIARE